jgi:hypothetical protein
MKGTAVNRLRVFAVVAVLGTAIAGCGGSEPIQVADAWARTSPSMTSAGAAYLDIVSDEGDRLTGASVDSSVAAAAEIHETTAMESDEGDSGSGDMSGAMTMREVEAIDLPAGQTVSLEPGGFHIMLLDLIDPLTPGETIQITLEFETADDVVVDVEVRDSAP